jgi:hypothetical protein
MKDMKLLRMVVVVALAAMAVLAIACSGGNNDTDAGSGDAAGIMPSAGMVVPNTFLEFNGKRYELVQILQDEFVQGASFRAVGTTTQADVDVNGELTVYERADDAEAVYTRSEKTVEDPAYWLRWRKTS